MKEVNDFLKIGDFTLYNNHHLVAFNKPSSVPVQPDKTEDPSLLQIGSVYCKSKLHLIHRLDRPVSGVVLLAKRKSAQVNLHEQFRSRTTKKIYLAIVANKPPEEEGELEHYISKAKGKHNAVVTEKEVPGSKLAQLKYKVIGSSDRYFLLKITLHTGRYHQIRAQLAYIGCPVRGDAKYGFRRRNKDRSVDLHAWQLTFKHPVNRQEEKLIASPPDTPLWQAYAETIAKAL